MKTTYVIENEQGQVIEYFKGLNHAKCYIKRSMEMWPVSYTILCLKGPYFGEGRHAYRMAYSNKTSKFRYLERR